MNTLIYDNSYPEEINWIAIEDDLKNTKDLIYKLELTTSTMTQVMNSIATEDNGGWETLKNFVSEVLKKIVVFLKKIALNFQKVFNQYNFYSLKMLKDKYLLDKSKTYYFIPDITIPAMKEHCAMLHVFNNNIFEAIPDALDALNDVVFPNMDICIEGIEQLVTLAKKHDNIDGKDSSEWAMKLDSVLHTIQEKLKKIKVNNIEFVVINGKIIYDLKVRDGSGHSKVHGYTLNPLFKTVEEYTNEDTTGNNAQDVVLQAVMKELVKYNKINIDYTKKMLTLSLNIEKFTKELEAALDKEENIITKSDLNYILSGIRTLLEELPNKQLNMIAELNKETLKFIDIMRCCTYQTPMQAIDLMGIDHVGYHLGNSERKIFDPTVRKLSKYIRYVDNAGVAGGSYIVNPEVQWMTMMEVKDKLKKININGIEAYDQPLPLDLFKYSAIDIADCLVKCVGACTPMGIIITSTGAIKRLADTDYAKENNIDYDLLSRFILGHEFGHKVDFTGGKELSKQDFINSQLPFMYSRRKEQELYADAYSIALNKLDLETYKKLRDGLLIMALQAGGVSKPAAVMANGVQKIIGKVNVEAGSYSFPREQAFEFSKTIKLL